MTVLRREDVHSRVASWDRRPYRMPSPPILAIVPLIIRRLRGPLANRLIKLSLTLPVSLLHRHRLKGGPQKPCELPRDRDGDLRCRFMFSRQFPEAPTQPLLRLVRNRNHAPGLSCAPPRQCHADARAMLIMPRRFNQQPPHQRVPGTSDAATPMLFATGVLAWHQPEIRHQRRSRGEPSKVMQFGEDQHGRQRIDATETAQPPDRLAIRLALGRLRVGSQKLGTLS
jgi:hypothetical protein